MNETVYLILKFKNDFISLPLQSEYATLANKFLEFSQFQNTIMAVDGTHIKITLPKSNSARFIDRKKQPSLAFLVCCDSFFRIRYVFGGTFGSTHDSFLFQASTLENWCEENLIGTNYHILGDSAFPERIYLKKPFKGELTES